MRTVRIYSVESDPDSVLIDGQYPISTSTFRRYWPVTLQLVNEKQYKGCVDSYAHDCGECIAIVSGKALSVPYLGRWRIVERTDQWGIPRRV